MWFKIRTYTNGSYRKVEWGRFEHTKAVFNNEIIPFLKSLKDIFNVFDRDLLHEIMEVKTVFDQIDAAVQQSSIDKQCLEIAKKELLLENDRLLIQSVKIEQADILWGIVKQAKSKQPLDIELDFACCPDFTLVSGLRMFETHDRESLSAHELSGKCYYLKGILREGLRHNLFSVGLFCDGDIEVSFRKTTCFIRNLKGVDLLSGSRDINFYTISLDDMLKTSLICLLSKASKTKTWLWHHRLSHLNFGTINKLAKDGLARGIPRLKFQKDHFCSACALGKRKKSSYQPKAEDTNQEKLYLLHMDLYGQMHVASINGKWYILVIVDDYSRFTWVRFLRIKDEAPEAIIKFIKNILVCLNATVYNVRTDNGTKFVNQTLREFYENVGIYHQTSVARTPQ
ncbi:retrovirus-related pol polyprotein from transposon TNT 1-94 [Tanacetum coccineum]